MIPGRLFRFLWGKFWTMYTDNLKIVLKAVSQLLQEIEGNIVITADHGEAFGEQGV